MAKSPWLGLVAIAGGIGFLSIQRNETYSDYGLAINEVEVKCGNAFDDRVETEFENPDEEYYYSSYDPIFDGQTADEVCDKLEGDAKLIGWGASGFGALWLVVGLARSSSRRQAALSKPQPFVPRPLASADVANGNPPRWLPDPQGIWEQRYWDGSRWTEHVASGGQVAVHPLSASPPGVVQSAPTPAPTPTPTPAPAPSPLPQPLTVATDHDGRTVSRAALAGMRPAAGVRLRFDDATTWEGSGPVLIGREPAGQPGEDPTSLHPILDPTRSVSKTHLLLSPTPGGVRIVDRHSSNGTEIVVAGVTTPVVPGVATDVPDGATVRVGDRSFVVEWVGGGPS